VVFAVAGVAASAQMQSLPSARQRMEITLEREDGVRWVTVPGGFVFESGERVRFRYRSNFDGYLYVMNYGSSGNYVLLFPQKDSGMNNEIKAGREYIVPAESRFRITGPPGLDMLYWVVTPLQLGKNPSADYLPLPPPPKAGKPHALIPRCDDQLLRARGMCIDVNAGPRNAKPDTLPDNLAHLPRVSARDLMIMNKDDSSVISSAVPGSGPIVYEFRLAHK
jgi:Domain of unknown function (DUF4384)